MFHWGVMKSAGWYQRKKMQPSMSTDWIFSGSMSTDCTFILVEVKTLHFSTSQRWPLKSNNEFFKWKSSKYLNGNNLIFFGGDVYGQWCQSIMDVCWNVDVCRSPKICVFITPSNCTSILKVDFWKRLGSTVLLEVPRSQ